MLKNLWMSYGDLIKAAAAAIFLAYGMIYAQGAADAAEKVEAASHEARITRLEGKQEATERRQIRIDGNVELIMRGLRIKPLPPVDGEGR